MAELPCKTIAQSRIVLSQLMRPEDANPQGNVHGGVIMRLADEAGALACTRHAQRMVVTVVIDSMTFNHPIHLNDLVIVTGQVTCAGRTSMEARIDVEAENPLTGVRIHTNAAYILYVALDDQGHPAPVPLLCGETEEEREEMVRAEERQSERLARAGRPAEPGTGNG